MSKAPRTHCLVIGNGAVGTAIACRLHMLGFRTSFVGRKGPVYIKSRLEAWGKTTYLDIQPLSQTDLSQIKIVFITVKAYDLQGALDRYLSYVPRAIPVVILSNGAIEDLVYNMAKKHEHFLWRMGVCTFGVSHISTGIYALKSKEGKAIWGSVQLNRASVTSPSTFEVELFNTDRNEFFQWSDGIVPVVRKKWLFNVVINSLCAANELSRNGELLADMKQLRQVFEEGFRLGYELWGNWPEGKERYFVDLVSLISSTSENENSMAKDVRAGGRTENEFLAKLAENRRGYEFLPKLSQKIESKMTQLSRRKEKK
ncbi:MAG: ketopantoate reductase family protein [Oligoflexales bacterium]|nr:ketopantoate reductase family protein [Oligoflexales bacterium]